MRNTVKRHNPERTIIDSESAISMYRSGMSEKAVADYFGCSRNVIRTRLIKNGIPIRGRSEAELLKWSQMSDEKKANQVQSAHDAVRAKPREFFIEPSIKQAIAKQESLSKVGKMEVDVMQSLVQLGWKCVPQKAFYVYNIDIFVAGVNDSAVEIHINTGYPHAHRLYRKRIIQLLERNLSAIYVKIDRHFSLEDVASKIHSLLNFINSDKSGIAKYWMITGRGETRFVGKMDGVNLTCEPATDNLF